MSDIRDFGIAVSNAIRLNDCCHQLTADFTAHPLIEGDTQLLQRNVVIEPVTPETLAWVHRSNCEEIAEHWIRVGILDRKLPLWIRTATTEELVDLYSIVTIQSATLSTGTYRSDQYAAHYLHGRPLWIKLTDWRSFVAGAMQERYSAIPTTTRAPSFKLGRPPSDDEVTAKADEMRRRGMTTRQITGSMRHEPGFENVATRDVRRLVDGRYSRTGRAGIPKE